MNLSHALKATAATIGLLAIPVAGISAIPNQNSSSIHTGISDRTEGDSNPPPFPTVTRYMRVPAPLHSTGTCNETIEIGPEGGAPTPARTPYAGVPGLAYTHTVHVKVPCPVAAVTTSPSATH